MKVHIGPYRTWIGPYQIADAICFWEKKKGEEANLSEKLGDWLAKIDWLVNLCEWVESKKKRKIRVRIDKYDTWGMDVTLALIILPMLKQLQATKMGAPLIDDDDVPVELRSTSAPAVDNDGDTDQNFFRRWDWVLGEMIFAFECQIDEDHLGNLEDGLTRMDDGIRLFGKYYRCLWD